MAIIRIQVLTYSNSEVFLKFPKLSTLVGGGKYNFQQQASQISYKKADQNKSEKTGGQNEKTTETDQ